MREIREGFNTLDRDRSGKLSVGEIKFFLKATNVTDNEQEIKRIVKEMDIDQDGEISK
jgi:Ca2+-binding EF-hand superfamily protein